jgi:hypothetical protein
MAERERMREMLAEPPRPDYWQERAAEGWRLAAVEWERGGGAQAAEQPPVEVPFGLRVARNCLHLEEDPVEVEILAMMLELIAADLSLSQVASELNQRGHPTRGGEPWTQVAAFNLLPRLIEAAPEIRRRRGRGVAAAMPA